MTSLTGRSAHLLYFASLAVAVVFAMLVSATPAHAAAWKACKVVNVGNGYYPSVKKVGCGKARKVAKAIAQSYADTEGAFTVKGFRCMKAVEATTATWSCKSGRKRIKVMYDFV